MIIFYFVLISKKRSEKFWIKANYIWLSIFALGILPATWEVKNIKVRREIESQKRYVEKWFESALVSANEHATSHEGWVEKYPQYSDYDSNFKASAKWFRKVENELRFGYRSDRWRRFMKSDSTGQPEDIPGPIKKSRTNMIKKLKILASDVDLLGQLESEMTPSNMQIILNVYLQFLLPIAFALCFLKVKAQSLGHC